MYEYINEVGINAQYIAVKSVRKHFFFIHFRE